MGLDVVSHLHPVGSFDLSDHPVPTGREEVWRFTPLKRLRGLHDAAVFGGEAYDVKVELPEGVRADGIEVADSERGLSGFVPTDRIAARVWESAPRCFTIDVPAEAVPTEPVYITVTGLGGDQPLARNVLVKVGAFARATVVVRFEGTATWADTVEIVLADGAQLTYVTIQDWADDAVHHSTQHARVGRDASLKHVAVTFGGDVVRHDVTATYAGSGGSAELLGLYFADAGQHVEHRLFVDHNQPKTSSNVVYKGALQGQGAHTVWIGNVLIRQEAEGISTYEENRNLVLTDGCQADSVPNLEIETGEIEGAGHASATGRFDDEQLFYLRSRGVSESEARRLVVHGFFDDLIRRIGVPEIEAQLRSTVEVELAKNALKDLS
jgi:Fe-S cluster assembly protein SufD